ncbi:Homeobox domain-like,HTH CenpB-type DNA-binding domain [Cinara cedri]|uniref:Homeobox domain-like,HTH CenpB-type DNA-binding domain n=1 Tax=Cinara cedri TaxID=506608 RepID=A0A5E4NTC0_9HEMI|nr:Homeobox domain-like,HTH CenpB-type DNA-binding domain [Cinara cedri]
MSRKDLTLVEKISILYKIKAQPHSLRDNSAPVNKKRKREGKDPEVDKAMNEWFSAVTERGVRISGPMLQQKAEYFAEKIGHGNFKATEGWMSRWKDRNNIKFKRFHGDKSSADSNGADEWSLTKLPESSKINILQAIQFVADSWRKVSSVTIQHCFAHCGFRTLIDLPIPSFVSIENNVAQCVGNGELFLKIDDGVQCFNENENYDNILDEIAERSLQNEESDENDDVQPVKITREAEKCIDQLRLYFMQNGNENVPTTSLDVYADFINKQSLDKLQQRRMDDFLQPNMN